MSIRVRFAPSPTGNLHIGGARTALFNWLFARRNGGKFLIRIEDTDLERSSIESRESILEALAWQGLDHDEDIVIQTERRGVHVELAERLLAEGKAYKCYATSDEIAAMRERAVAQGRTRTYERTWRDVPEAEHPSDRPYVVRLKAKIDGKTTLSDKVLGDITIDNDTVDDFIILRSDGSPTYNFVVVCDDAFMQITHVIRGQDHVANTFKQMLLYEALGYELPVFAHLPLIDGLSKRKGSMSVQHYRDIGYLSEGVNNYIARLGWSHGDDEIFGTDELIEKFSLEGVNRGNSKYDDVKFAWVNSQWMKRVDTADLTARLLPFLAAEGVETEADETLQALVTALQPRAEDLVSMARQALFPYRAPTAYDEKATKKWLKAGTKDAFVTLVDTLESLEDWTGEAIEAAFADVVERTEVKMGKLAQPVRIGITGTSVSPPIDVTLAAVPKDDAIARLRAVIPMFPTPA